MGSAVATGTPDTFSLGTGLYITRSNTASTTVTVSNALNAGYLYEVVSAGSNTDWYAVARLIPGVNAVPGQYFIATGASGGSSATGTARKIPGGGVTVNDTTRFADPTSGWLSNFYPGIYSYSKYGSAGRFFSEAGANSISDVSVLSIYGSANIGLQIFSDSNKFTTAALSVTNTQKLAAIFDGGTNTGTSAVTITNTTGGQGLLISAGGSSSPALKIVTGNKNNLAINVQGTIETDGQIISTANTASTSTTSGSLLVIGGAGISGAVYAGSLYDNGNRVLTTANAYSLPTASTSTLGGIKIDGSTLAFNGSGQLYATGAGYAGYTLPVATASVLGGVKQGTNVTIAGDGTINVATGAGYSYSLPVATASVLGGVKQGTNVTIAGDGTLSVATGAGYSYSLPVATASTLGGVKQGTNVTIAGDGTISVATGAGYSYSLPTASTSTLGGVKVDGSTITINGSGVISSSSTAFNGGSISGTLTLTNTTASSSTTTGALIVAGGMGITGKIYAADNITSYANITANVFYADNNYYWQVISGSPYLVFDSTDYISYDRSNNQLNTIIAGSGILALNTTAVQTYKPLRIFGTSSGYVGFNVQASAGSTTYTWPASPTSNYFLQTDGSGNLSWAAASGGGTTYSEATPTTLGLVYGRVGTSSYSRNNSSTALGYQALAYNPAIPQFGSYNCTAVGLQALYSNTNGTTNTAVGALALYYNTGGGHNVAVGSTAGISQTYAIYNTFIGDGAGYSVTTGNYNTAIGGGSLVGTTQDYNTSLGYYSGTQNTSYTNFTSLGANSTVTGSNQLQLGDSSTTSYAYGSIQNRSDIRDKADVRDTQLGLEFINALRPVDYKWDLREDYKPARLDISLPIPPIDPTPEQTAEYNTALEAYNSAMVAWRESAKMSNLVHDGSKKRNRYHHGLIAQEVKAVLDAQGIDFGGYQDHKIKDGEDVLSIGYEELIAPLIKAVQQLTARVQQLEAKNI